MVGPQRHDERLLGDQPLDNTGGNDRRGNAAYDGDVGALLGQCQNLLAAFEFVENETDAWLLLSVGADGPRDLRNQRRGREDADAQFAELAAFGLAGNLGRA